MNRKEIGEKIKSLRKQKNISQNDMADAIRVKQNTVSAYETGAIDVMPKIQEIAKFLKVPLTDLLEEKGLSVRETMSNYGMPPGAIPLDTSEYILLPVFAKIPCSLPDYSDHDISARQPVPKYIYTTIYTGAEYIVLAKGDSMAPAINDGALCYVKPATIPVNGAIMLLKFEDSCQDGFTIKIVRLKDDSVELEPINKKHKNIVCKSGVCRVIGEVVGISQPAPRF